VPLFLSVAKAVGGDNLPIMQDDRVHWNGQPIAVVLAETQERPDHATSLIRTARGAANSFRPYFQAASRSFAPTRATRTKSADTAARLGVSLAGNSYSGAASLSFDGLC
jgi:CO/xanthine dehydrogenase Mo-binding subunit